MIERVPPDRWEYVERFTRAINTLVPPSRAPFVVALTPVEWNRLAFLRWRLEKGRVKS